MAAGAGARTSDVLELLRVLLLVQGAILVASAIETFAFSLVFGSAAAALLTAAAAVALLVSRARLTASRSARRVVRAIEVIVLLTVAVDVALALFLAHAAPPAVAVLTRFVLPVAIVALLERTTAAAAVLESASAELAA
jgi:hypothetical protein